MPETFQKYHRHPARPLHRLKDAARTGQIIIMHCHLCRRTLNFLASDLMTVVAPDRPADAPLFPCSKCGKIDYVHVNLHGPSDADYGHLVIRRPGKVKRIQTWHSVLLGDEPP